MAFTGLATKVYKDPVTVQWVNSIKDNFDIIITGVGKAWVNFDGTAPPVIRGSFNVASVTRAAIGVYTINFTTGFTTGGYVVAGNLYDTGSQMHIGIDRTATDLFLTGSIGIETYNDAGTLLDSSIVCLIAFGARNP